MPHPTRRTYTDPFHDGGFSARIRGNHRGGAAVGQLGRRGQGPLRRGDHPSPAGTDPPGGGRGRVGTVSRAARAGSVAVAAMAGCMPLGPAQAALAAAQADLALPAPPSGFTFVETNAQGYDEYTHDSSGIRFVRLPGRSFEMGSPEGETGRIDPYEAVHTVWLTPFLIAKYEVKQSEYEGVMTGNTAGLDATPSTATGANLPVEQVSWDDLHATDGFLERTGLVLPSEAQWEYACRAGTSGPYAGNGNLDDMGWHSGNSGDSTHDVGGKSANQFGLHDMHGNVLEWCEDVYKSDFYADDVPGFDPVSILGSGRRVLRGGFFSFGAQFARSALRAGNSPTDRLEYLGFRPLSFVFKPGRVE